MTDDTDEDFFLPLDEEDEEADPRTIAEERIAEAKRTGATKLDLSGLGLTTPPEYRGKFAKLTTLIFGDRKSAPTHDQQATELPESLGQLTNLNELDLSKNKLSGLPKWMGRLVNLTKLSLNENQLATVPTPICKLTSLAELDLSQNQLSAVPEWISRLYNLTTLNL